MLTIEIRGECFQHIQEISDFRPKASSIEARASEAEEPAYDTTNHKLRKRFQRLQGIRKAKGTKKTQPAKKEDRAHCTDCLCLIPRKSRA